MRPVPARTPIALSVALALLLPLGLSACAPAPGVAAEGTASAATPEAVATETARLNAWFEAQYEEQLKFSPLRLTFLGRKELYDQLDDVSDAGIRRQLEWMEASVREMEAEFDHDRLDPEAQLSWALWKKQYENLRDGMPFLLNGYAFDQMNGMHSMAPTFMINFHRVDEESDYAAYVARLRALPTVFDTLVERGRRASAEGIHIPKFALDGVIEQSRKVIAGAPFDGGADSALWADAQAKADALAAAGRIDGARAAELKEQARRALLDEVKPAYERVIAFAEAELPHAPVNPTGIVQSHPNGADYYAYLLRQHTSTDMDADRIHALGLAEVARLRGELEKVQAEIGFEGDLQAFFAHVQNDPARLYPNTDAGRQAYIDDATAAIDNIRQYLPEYFGLLPKAELVVKRVEAFREQEIGRAHV